MRGLTQNLFPILKAVGGDFYLGICYNLAGEALVDLRFVDEGGTNIDPFAASFETSAKLGGLINPNVAPFDVVNQNAYMMERLVNQCGIDMMGSSYRDLLTPSDYRASSVFRPIGDPMSAAVSGGSVPSMPNANPGTPITPGNNNPFFNQNSLFK